MINKSSLHMLLRIRFVSKDILAVVSDEWEVAVCVSNPFSLIELNYMPSNAVVNSGGSVKVTKDLQRGRGRN